MGRSKQYAERANILKKIHLGQAWKFAPVVEKAGKILRDHVWVSGCGRTSPGRQLLSGVVSSGKTPPAFGWKFDAALDAARRKSLEIQAVHAGIVQSQELPAAAQERLTIGAAIDSYLDFIEHHRSPRTYLTYRYTLDTLLLESYRKPYIDQAEREDVLKFMTDCYKRGLGNRTVYDKLVVALQFFKAMEHQADRAE